MSFINKLSFFLLNIYLLMNQGFSMNYYNQEEFDKAKIVEYISVTAIGVKVDSISHDGSAMVYRHGNKMIGITTAHTFDNAIRKNFNNTTLHVYFNLDIDKPLLSIVAPTFWIHPDYKPSKTIVEKRDPKRVKNDLAVFSIPYFYDNFFSHLFEFKLDPTLPSNKEYQTIAYSFGPSHTTDLKTFYGLDKYRQQIQAILYYDDQNDLFKKDYVSNQLLLTLNKITHDIRFDILVNEPSETAGLPGDSGANTLDQNTEFTIAVFSGYDCMAFFERKSLLAQFYSQCVIMAHPSQERTDNFLRNLDEYGRIVKEKELGNTICIAFESQEPISCSTLFVPLYLHHDFIMKLINDIPVTELKPYPKN